MNQFSEREIVAAELQDGGLGSQHETPVYGNKTVPAYRSMQPAPGMFGRVVWLATAATMILIVWFIGPMVVENYKYSATRGKVRAEYENAVEMLKDQPLEGVSLAYQLVAQKVRPSVVSIQARRTGQSFVRVPTLGQGSGVIMSADGYVLTNAHVVQDAVEVEVVLHDRRAFDARLVGKADVLNDLAVLKIDAANLVPAEWGDSDSIEVGSIVWAIGSPYGLDQSVTSGIISAKNRFDIRAPHQQLIQTDAAVNPGNSGGPLVDSQGRVIGINTSIFGEQFQGISFAVPSSIARFVYEQTVEQGYVSRGMLGVRPVPVFQEQVERFQLPDINGAMIYQITPNSPAERAGLQRYDVVRSWNGQPIIDFANLYRYVDMTEPNSKAELVVFRDGEQQTLEVTVGSRDEFEKYEAFTR
jgi:S1-C subfamily serine protease